MILNSKELIGGINHFDAETSRASLDTFNCDECWK